MRGSSAFLLSGNILIYICLQANLWGEMGEQNRWKDAKIEDNSVVEHCAPLAMVPARLRMQRRRCISCLNDRRVEPKVAHDDHANSIPGSGGSPRKISA